MTNCNRMLGRINSTIFENYPSLRPRSVQVLRLRSAQAFSTNKLFIRLWAQKKPSNCFEGLYSGWKTGLEPATLGTTNRCSNQLSYNHHVAASCDAFPPIPVGRCKCILFTNVYKDFLKKNYTKSNKLLTAG